MVVDEDVDVDEEDMDTVEAWDGVVDVVEGAGDAVAVPYACRMLPYNTIDHSMIVSKKLLGTTTVKRRTPVPRKLLILRSKVVVMVN